MNLLLEWNNFYQPTQNFLSHAPNILSEWKRWYRIKTPIAKKNDYVIEIVHLELLIRMKIF